MYKLPFTNNLNIYKKEYKAKLLSTRKNLNLTHLNTVSYLSLLKAFEGGVITDKIETNLKFLRLLS